jgi:hypothetical protein
MAHDRSTSPPIRNVIAITITLAVLGGASIAQMSPPARRAGWWESTMNMSMGGRPQTIVQHMCTDAATEKSYSVLSGGMSARANCSRRNVEAIPGGWRGTSVCNFGNSGPRTTTSTMTGDFQSHVHVDIESQSARGPEHMSIDMKWLGACPAGRIPGDVVMPGGQVYNMTGDGMAAAGPH